jgi:hypothetical protein
MYSSFGPEKSESWWEIEWKLPLLNIWLCSQRTSFETEKNVVFLVRIMPQPNDPPQSCGPLLDLAQNQLLEQSQNSLDGE